MGNVVHYETLGDSSAKGRAYLLRPSDFRRTVEEHLEGDFVLSYWKSDEMEHTHEHPFRVEATPIVPEEVRPHD